MAGFVIHLAVAQEYLRNNRQIKENEQQFLFGSVQPDFIMPKTASHYGKSPAYTDLKKFLELNETNTSLDKGRFIHLITDYLFYNHYIGHVPKEELHNDYDLINKQIVEKYRVKIIDEVKDKIYYKEGTPKYLTYETACKFINEVSKIDLEKAKKEILKGNKKWNVYRKNIE